ncbi:MAG: SH3 domain-containing protein [Atribacterota bacterium]
MYVFVRKLLLLSVLSFFLILNCFGQIEEIKIDLIVDSAKIHLNPSEKSPVISVVTQDKSLKYIDKISQWYLVQFVDEDGLKKTGYIHETLVKVEKKGRQEEEIIKQEKKLISDISQYETNERKEKTNKFGLGIYTGLPLGISPFFEYKINKNFGLQAGMSIFKQHYDALIRGVFTTNKGIKIGNKEFPFNFGGGIRIGWQTKTEELQVGFDLNGGIEFHLNKVPNLILSPNVGFILFITGEPSKGQKIGAGESGETNVVIVNSSGLWLGIQIIYFFK